VSLTLSWYEPGTSWLHRLDPRPKLVFVVLGSVALVTLVGIVPLLAFLLLDHLALLSAWVLVGDAGYNKDFITAHGIQDAFRDAALCATALDEAYTGVRPFDVAMRAYQEQRDAHVLPIYELTCELATLEPPPPEMQQLLGAVQGNQEAMDGFARVVAGATSPAEYFSAANVRRLLAPAR
jgi:2-polyprenyl-6-methoxyphenol hydroxylase-like FAD-dependent oxidoreductase